MCIETKFETLRIAFKAETTPTEYLEFFSRRFDSKDDQKTALRAQLTLAIQRNEKKGSKPDHSTTWQGSTICDFCKRDARTVDRYFVDGRTSFGSWGLMCADDYYIFGCGLGQGFGQAYSSQTLQKIKGEL